MPTASARLTRKLDLVAPAFAAPGRLLHEHPNARELFPRYDAASSYLTLAMVPLMEVAFERARALAPDDPVAAGLAVYLEKHIPEELHGGAPGRAGMDDLEALGVDTVALREGPVPARMAEYIGNLCFWIWHRHPVAILGFLALEAFHPETSRDRGADREDGTSPGRLPSAAPAREARRAPRQGAAPRHRRAPPGAGARGADRRRGAPDGRDPHRRLDRRRRGARARRCRVAGRAKPLYKNSLT